MSQWSHENPELVGTPSDPWYMHASYREAMSFVKQTQPDTYCSTCEAFLEPGDRKGQCDGCREEAST